MATATQQTSALPDFKRDFLGELPSLRAFAISLIGHRDQAEDLLQDTILKAWAKRESFQPGTNLRAWLFTILRNEFYSQMRKAGREVSDADGVITDNVAVPPSQQSALDMADFKLALARLPDDQREAIILVGASGFSYEEAANVCKCAVGTMKSRVSRARSRLQELMQVSGSHEFGIDRDSASSISRSFSS